MDTAWTGYAAAALGAGAGAGRARTGGCPPRDCGRVPNVPPPSAPPARDGGGPVGAQWGWRARGAAEGVGWGDACLLTKENEWDTMSRPAPPRLEGRRRGSVRREGAGLSFTWPLRRRRSGRAGSRVPPGMRSTRGGGARGRSPQARVPSRRRRRHVSAGERKRGAYSAGTGGRGRESEGGIEE